MKGITTWSCVKRRVHIITPLVAEILTAPVNNARTLAKILGCSPYYIYMVRGLKRSRAHVWVTPEERKALFDNEKEGRIGRRKGE